VAFGKLDDEVPRPRQSKADAMVARLLCQAAGGTYANGTCQPATNPRTAAEMCRAHGGTYFAGGDYCEVEGAWKP
jgi:hypothetical protein